MRESDILQRIILLKEMMQQCIDIENKIKAMVAILQGEWDREDAPKIESLKTIIELNLLQDRNKLAEIRGE